jgi:hypothetical protein
METYDGREMQFAWNGEKFNRVGDENIGSGFIVGSWPDRTRWIPDYWSTCGACNSYWRDMTDEELFNEMMLYAIRVSLFDGIPIETIHREFWKANQWRDRLMEDPDAFDWTRSAGGFWRQ